MARTPSSRPHNAEPEGQAGWEGGCLFSWEDGAFPGMPLGKRGLLALPTDWLIHGLSPLLTDPHPDITKAAKCLPTDPPTKACTEGRQSQKGGWPERWEQIGDPSLVRVRDGVRQT